MFQAIALQKLLEWKATVVYTVFFSAFGGCSQNSVYNIMIFSPPPPLCLHTNSGKSGKSKLYDVHKT